MGTIWRTDSKQTKITKRDMYNGIALRLFPRIFFIVIPVSCISMRTAMIGKILNSKWLTWVGKFIILVRTRGTKIYALVKKRKKLFI